MTDEEFEAIDSKLLEHADKVLLNRKGAYAQAHDRLANFKEASQRTGLTPEKVCEVYLEKALSAMLKILHGAPAIGETVLDRFSDPLNYVRLAHGLVMEKQVHKPLEVKVGEALMIMNKSVKPTPLERALNRYVD